MSLQDLGEITIISSAKRLQPISRSSSAIYVITAEDIRLAGVQKLDDILRLVPGMDVAHISTAGGIFFAFSARGFARPSSEKMQVLVDGRPLYNPFRAGVELGIEPIFHENIERIEVIRGSGGVVWGVNAMNGVVNIITKKAADTQGGLITSSFGNRETADGFLRYGESTGNLSWRISTGTMHDNGFGNNGGRDIKDGQQGHNFTARFDYQFDQKTNLTLSMGHRESDLGFGEKDPIRLSLQYFNFLLERHINDNESIQFRWNENFYDRNQAGFDQSTGERMIELQHNLSTGKHNIVSGIDYTQDRFSTAEDSTKPNSFKNNQFSAFIQDEITLRNDLWLTMGYRAHTNEISHYDWAANIALVHEVRTNHFLRASVSRAFRRPYMFESFAFRGNGKLTGNDRLVNEEMISYELGYRGKLLDSLELNIEFFLNQYSDLIGTQKGATTTSHFNSHNLQTYGVETNLDWRIKQWWLLRASHTYEYMENEG